MSLLPLSAIAAPIRVMIVDDSLVIRGFMTRTLESDPRFKVVATAANGALALGMLQQYPADVIILDIDMPIMDGLTAIPKLKAIDPGAQIIMASTVTEKNAEISLKAMSLGATDYVPKPSAKEMAVPGEFQRDLRERVKTCGAIARRKNVRATSAADPSHAPMPVEKKKMTLRSIPPFFQADVIAVAASTGGPQALFEVIKVMGDHLPQPIVITQHMPASFTAILAEHIAKQCGVRCREAQEGDILQAGSYYIAPGDFHLLVLKKPEGAVVHLVKDPQENFCRPAADPMLRSLVEVYGGHILTVILTGMGQDGCKGAEAVTQAGGVVIAQDEATSVVWGMPGMVVGAGLCSAIVAVDDMGALVRQMAIKGRAGADG